MTTLETAANGRELTRN